MAIHRATVHTKTFCRARTALLEAALDHSSIHAPPGNPPPAAPLTDMVVVTDTTYRGSNSERKMELYCMSVFFSTSSGFASKLLLVLEGTLAEVTRRQSA